MSSKQRYSDRKILNRTSALVDMVALLVKAPRAVDELSDLTGAKAETVYRWAKLLEGEGLLARSFGSVGEQGGRRPHIYTWKA